MGVIRLTSEGTPVQGPNEEDGTPPKKPETDDDN